jgi:hypothetical protein
MTQLVKHAPPFITKKSTTSPWHHQRRAITRFVVKEIVIADALMMPRGLVVGFLIIKGGACFTNCVILLHNIDV